MRAVLAIFALLTVAPAAAAAPNVEIRRTSHGIPHIKPKTFFGAAYGYGYAFAQDNLCEIAETYVTVNGERLRRVRATVNGKRVNVKRSGRRGVRVSLRGRPKGRHRIRVTAKTSRMRAIELDRRARTCVPRAKR